MTVNTKCPNYVTTPDIVIQVTNSILWQPVNMMNGETSRVGP